MSDVRSEIEARGKPTLGAADAAEALQLTDDVVGSGDEVTPGATVTAHYVGVSALRSVPSSTRPGTAAHRSASPSTGSSRAGARACSACVSVADAPWTIPGHLAYGAHPPPGAGIAPNETLVFTVDLVDVSWR